MKQYLAHSATDVADGHTLKDHLESVAELASGFAASFGAEREARLAGLLHDLGKYGDLFQDRLKDPRRITGVDHWTMGAWATVNNYPRTAVAATLAAFGHHLGLPPLDKEILRSFRRQQYQDTQRRLSESNLGTLLDRLQCDGIELPPAEGFKGEITVPGTNKPAAAMLDYRMLYSALVDADFLDTEAHFSRQADGIKRPRRAGPDLNPAWAAGVLRDHIRELAATSTSDPALNRLRADLLEACRTSAAEEPGRFTLSAPTGAGKTLAMLAFALEHAAAHGLRRVVMVIPYLTIIDQTTQVFREVFRSRLPSDTDVEHYILEHHSLAGLHSDQADGGSDQDAIDPVERRRRELAENWDAPIIVTTSVQMLESLFARRSGACRKLHRLAKSVILFDEVQTLPTHLAGATLATLGRLCDRFGSTVVFFHRHPAGVWRVERIGAKTGRRGLGAPRDCPHGNRPFQEGGEKGAGHLASQGREPQPGAGGRQAGHGGKPPQPVRGEPEAPGHRHTAGTSRPGRTRPVPPLHQHVPGPPRGGVKGSTPPADRPGPAAGAPGLHPVRGGRGGPGLSRGLARLGPLTAIAQAAGRCNRNANLEFGLVRVFRLDEGGKNPYPDDAYGQAAMTTEAILERRGPEGMDINDPELFKVFYQRLYLLRGDNGGSGTLAEAIKRRHFEDTARRYRLIDKNSINILVPYDPKKYAQLAEEARNQGLTRDWIARARPHTVGWFRPREGDSIYDVLEPIPLIGGSTGVRGKCRRTGSSARQRACMTRHWDLRSRNLLGC